MRVSSRPFHGRVDPIPPLKGGGEAEMDLEKEEEAKRGNRAEQ